MIRPVDRPASHAARTPPVDRVALRTLCLRLMADLPARQRVALIDRMERRLRRNDDLPILREAVYDLIEQQHGADVAEQRVSQFDALFG